MRQSDINRKTFHRGHWMIIAGQFKYALEPYMIDRELRDKDGKLASDAVIQMSVLSSLAILAVNFAKRLMADNEDFDPIMFLDRCSPDPDKYPISELWEIVEDTEDEVEDDNSGND